MIILIRGSSFKRSFRKTIESNRYLKEKFAETIGIFVDDPICQNYHRLAIGIHSVDKS